MHCIHTNPCLTAVTNKLTKCSYQFWHDIGRHLTSLLPLLLPTEFRLYLKIKTTNNLLKLQPVLTTGIKNNNKTKGKKYCPLERRFDCPQLNNFSMVMKTRRTILRTTKELVKNTTKEKDRFITVMVWWKGMESVSCQQWKIDFVQ